MSDMGVGYAGAPIGVTVEAWNAYLDALAALGSHAALASALQTAQLDATYVGVRETVNTVAASGAAVTIPDVTTATLNDVTLTAACTFTFPAAAAGKSFSIIARQDGTGSRLATWPASVKWPNGVAPVLSTAVNAIDFLAFVSDGTIWLGNLAGNNFS